VLTYPNLNPGYPWLNLSLTNQWKKDPSQKLDILVELISWHQEQDNCPPLKVQNDKLVSSEVATATSGIKSASPDKKVVYCAFPSSYAQITQVSIKLFLFPILSVF
jgi:hypothetical protein